jgi:hypothetical protein
VGYARLDKEAKFVRQIRSAILKSAVKGIITNWSADAWLVDADLRVQFEGQIRKVDGDANLSFRLG